MHANLNAGVSLPEAGKRWQERVNGAFVHAQRQLTALQTLEFGEPFLDLVAQVQQPLRILLEQCSRIGETHGPGAANEQRLAQGIFQLADAEADRRLGPVEAFGRAREAALLGNHQKNLQFA